MTLLEQLNTDLEQALRAGQSSVVGTLRMVKAAIQNAAIAKGSALTDEEVVQLIRKEYKRREEAAVLYEQHGSLERAKAERDEAILFTPYLPAALDETAALNFIQEQITCGAATDMGSLMRLCKAHFGATADGKVLSRLITETLKTS